MNETEYLNLMDQIEMEMQYRREILQTDCLRVLQFEAVALR